MMQAGEKAVVSSAAVRRPRQGAGRAIGVSRAVHGLFTGGLFRARNVAAVLCLSGVSLTAAGVDKIEADPKTEKKAVSANACPESKCGYWFYKEPPPDEETKDDEPKTLPPPPLESELVKMKPADFQKTLQSYLDQALTTLQPQHVQWYYQLQDFARRRSRAFMNVTEMVMLNNPTLNMNTAYPVSPPGINARVTQRQSSFDERLAREKDSAAIVLLTRASCGMCEAQRGVLKYFQQKHDWKVTEFDIGEHPEIAAKFSTEFTPTTIVIFRGSTDWMPVAVGVETVPRIEEGVYKALRAMHGETTPQQFGTQEFEDGGIMDPQRNSQ